MSKLSEIIAALALNAKMGKPVKREMTNGAEIGFIAHKSQTKFFVRRPTDNRPQGEPPPEAFTREAIVFRKHAEDAGLKLGPAEYGRTAKHLFALFPVSRWPGEGPQQAALEDAAGVGRA